MPADSAKTYTTTLSRWTDSIPPDCPDAPAARAREQSGSSRRRPSIPGRRGRILGDTALFKLSGFLVWLIAAAITVVWVLGIRKLADSGVTRQTVNTTMLFFSSVIVVPAAGLSPFHLLWIFPVSWLSGTLSLTFPFSLLSIPGELFFRACSIGRHP